MTKIYCCKEGDIIVKTFMSETEATRYCKRLIKTKANRNLLEAENVPTLMLDKTQSYAIYNIAFPSITPQSITSEEANVTQYTVVEQDL